MPIVRIYGLKREGGELFKRGIKLAKNISNKTTKQQKINRLFIPVKLKIEFK